MTSGVAADAVARADANLRAASRAWALACETGEAWEDSVVVASSGVPIRSFNVAYVTGAPRVDTLRRVRDYFAGRGVPFRLRIRDDIELDGGDTLAEAGLQEHGGIPSLVLAPIRPGGTTDLDVRRVADGEALRQHVDVIAAAFGWPPDILGLVFSERLLHNASWRGYVAYVDGQPVATSQLFAHGGTAGIYYVATLEQCRRRGLGEAMTWHVMREGATAGCDMASLQASPMGLPIYERMGFRRVRYYQTYVLKEA